MTKLWRPELVRPTELRRWQAVWETTGNTAAAWRCFHLARLWSLPVPASVFAELDRIASAFEDEVQRSRDAALSSTRRTGDIGLKRETVGRIVTRAGRGSNDPAVELLAWERDFAIDSAVSLLRQNGESERISVERVAAGTSDLAFVLCFEGASITFSPISTPAVSVDVVRRAVRRVRQLFDNAVTDGATDERQIADLKHTTISA